MKPVTCRPRVLVAGVGNIFLSDDGFGPEVARRLVEDATTPDVRVVDYGIAGIHLAYDLLDGCDTLVLVDTVGRGGEPGTVSVIEVAASDVREAAFDGHSMDPGVVFATLRRLGGTLPRTLLVGCEPTSTHEGIGLSPPVEAAVDVAVAAVRDLVAAELARDPAATGAGKG